ncbi:polysaccharide deacetylase family protein [Piscinibacter sakaiensis]|uniref:Polysaccharide deacetylase n=1 Tax=Piscinibacter sakaiensis TaxID=1547922 RepID=A0A0K8P3Y7_PISS1|nr:polysaccharide deacetylase family protein [Piscinibacter sakaiensis]GAP37296.1 polysaccharide deacetylase [Piscinibacter sakaiensis]
MARAEGAQGNGRAGARGRWPWPPLLRASLGVHAGAAALALWPGGWPWALGAVAANHALITATGLWPRSRGLGPNWTRLPDAPATAQAVALTIDDGPDPAVTPALLDLLAAHGARATFFCIGARAAAEPALLRRILAAGHAVENHSMHHRHHFSLLGPAGLRRELQQAQHLLEDLGGVRPIAFRAPAGLRNPFLDPVLHELGLHLVSWTRRGFDTREGRADTVARRLQRGLAARDILLLHDGHAARTDAGRPVLLEVLPPLLARCGALGLRTVTLREALPPRGG